MRHLDRYGAGVKRTDMTCPECGAEHLHFNMTIAETLGPFDATGVDPDGAIRIRRSSSWSTKSLSGHVSCCACDWGEERRVRLDRGLSPVARALRQPENG